jgi:hypothetical protein
VRVTERVAARRVFAGARVEAQGAAAKPLDGGALSHAGNALAGERTRRGAATPPTGPPWPLRALHLACMRDKGEGTE